MPYEVQIALFEGPLGLLLHLIEREELEVTAVSVSQIADQFLNYLSLLQERPADELADFLVMAARLLWIKSRALLPQPARPPVESPEEDPAELLARQLREYKRFRDAAAWLNQREDQGIRSYVRTAPPVDLPRRLAPGEIEVRDLVEALRQLLARTEPLPPAGTVAEMATVTVSQQISRILSLTRTRGPVGFRRLLARVTTRLEIIVTLLALLELVKQQRVAVRQSEPFGEIVVTGLPGAVPGHEGNVAVP